MKDKTHLSNEDFEKMVRKNKKNKTSGWYIFGYYILGPIIGIAIFLLVMLLVIAGIVGLWRFIF